MTTPTHADRAKAAAEQILPDNLHPFGTNHPASAAYRLQLSCHEWTWTQAEQEAIAEALLKRDIQIARLLRHVKDAADVIAKARAAHDAYYAGTLVPLQNAMRDLSRVLNQLDAARQEPPQ